MPDTALRLVETGPDDPLFRAWCEVWEAGERADRPDDPPRPALEHVALGRDLLTPGGSRTGTHRAALLDGRLVGALRLVLPLRDNLGVAAVSLGVHPDARRRGTGTALLREALTLARAAGREVLLGELDEPVPHGAGAAFLRRHRATRDLVEIRRDLPLPVDEARLAALEADARRAATGYELVRWRDRVPDALLADRAVLEERMSSDAPHGDLPVERERWDGDRVRELEASVAERGRTALSAGAVRDGRLVAFTDLHVPLAQPVHAFQGGTLVVPEHRGHRLGALVKAAVLRDLAAALPQVRRVRTYNSESNRPMVAVNEALGFVVAGELSTWSLAV